jgi:predicted secreted Zn-dependent protease
VTCLRKINLNPVVPAQGFEPWTIGLKDRCSNLAELRRHVQIVATRQYNAANVARHHARLSSRALVGWISLAAAAGLVACGTSGGTPTAVASPQTTASPIDSPTPASNGPIGLPPIPHATIVPYTITGETAAQLRADLTRLGPVDHGVHVDAFTQWDITWKWPTASNGSCTLSGATVNSTITITAPTWTPGPGVDPSLVAEWSRYITALATHEKGHIDYVVASVASILKAVHAATCSTANAAGNAIITRIRQHDIAYDAATHHGATQGAVFPLGSSNGGA